MGCGGSPGTIHTELTLTVLPRKANSGRAQLRNTGHWVSSFERSLSPRETSFKVDWERGGWGSDMERIRREQMVLAIATRFPPP